MNKKTKKLLADIDAYLALPNIDCARVNPHDYDLLVAALFPERERYRYRDQFIRNGKIVRVLKYGDKTV